MLKSLDEISIISHSFIITSLFRLDLLKEEFSLDKGIIQLGVGIAKFLMIDEELESKKNHNSI